MEEIKQLDDAKDILKLPNSWEEKGIEKGRTEEKREIALEMLKEGSSVEFIVKVTQLDKEEVESIKEKL
ncbi:hypothetical protein [Virgibacillus necropolis]|uniref:hypothetical protein n=1 Tax=Virgibacillus necropolis TaxID=163877 RepID=UPI00384AF886